MVRSIIIGLIILFNLILQSTLFQWVEIYGVVPNTSLILVMSFAIYSGRNRGAVIGFLMGILQDIIFGRTIGLNALVFMVIGYLIGLMDQKISKDNLLIPFVLTMLATVFYETINLLLLFLLGCRIELLNIIKKMLITEVIYNSFVSLVIYYYISKLFKLSLMKKGY
ncbi:MAG: rod shape-determining protein MreD [Natronincolaceae bacterium]|jgi:rod shape-determining protein MreD|nr:rod shape-determining protein MreD [Bacillota bacterium]